MWVPLDLVYLDEDCRVIDVVEFFPTFRVSPSSPPAASVLALPIHSIYSSQTQPGDQLILCAAEEITWRLEQLSSASGVAGPVPGAVRGPVLVKRVEPRSAGPVCCKAGSGCCKRRISPRSSAPNLIRHMRISISNLGRTSGRGGVG
jgi:hypothetical protein